MPSSSTSLVPGPLSHLSPLLPPLQVLKKKQERHKVQSHPKGCDGTRAGEKEEGMEGFLGLVPTSRPVTHTPSPSARPILPRVDTASHFLDEKPKAQRGHTMCPYLWLEPWRKQDQPMGGGLQACSPSSLSARAHRILPVGSLKGRDQRVIPVQVPCLSWLV